MARYSLSRFIQELEAWVSFSEAEKQAAKTSGKDLGNCPQFRQLFNDWGDGLYDNNIELLEQKVKSLLT